MIAARGIAGLWAALCLWLVAGAAMAQPQATLLTYADLDGWAQDDHAAALAVFRNTCGDMRDTEWQNLCDFAAQAAEGPTPAERAQNARTFFELFFLPVMITEGADMLFTGYFEPELRGALLPDAQYRYPIYSLPPELPASGPWLTRRQIEQSGRLADRGLEIAWLADPVDAIFLQIQGSGRVRLPDGTVIRVGYAGANRHPYTSLGQVLVRRGIYEPHQVSADVIRSWVSRNPDEGRRLLWANASYVFFREVTQVPAHLGPLGAMNRSVSELRTVAVDPHFAAMGAPVWIEKDGPDPLNRLMTAQDTGSAIKGAQRADIFYGTGRSAGYIAGRTRAGGRMVLLLPVQLALLRLQNPETVIR
ncbi:MAG: murein transglycosylase A [Rhodobacteraceae bacterium]|nr:murein transglycosylase A [Paracoccaceae bacterium]